MRHTEGVIGAASSKLYIGSTEAACTSNRNSAQRRQAGRTGGDPGIQSHQQGSIYSYN